MTEACASLGFPPAAHRRLSPVVRSAPAVLFQSLRKLLFLSRRNPGNYSRRQFLNCTLRRVLRRAAPPPLTPAP